MSTPMALSLALIAGIAAGAIASGRRGDFRAYLRDARARIAKRLIMDEEPAWRGTVSEYLDPGVYDQEADLPRKELSPGDWHEVDNFRTALDREDAAAIIGGES